MPRRSAGRIAARPSPGASTRGPDTTLESRISAVRRFNRFYTRTIGVIDGAHLRTEFSLADARILYELAHRRSPVAAELGRDLGLDPGYLSRRLQDLYRRGYIRREASASDARLQRLALTTAGRSAFRRLDRRASEEIRTLLQPLDTTSQGNVVAAMRTIEVALAATDTPEPGASYVLRDPRPGDLGWMVSRHGVLYAAEYGWNEQLEAIAAEVVAAFARHHDPRRERCWIAERDGVNVGSILLVSHPERPGVAKLRLLLVEPSVRGLGIGRRLVDECLRFARHARYHTITLWTNDVLTSARHLYEDAGFQLLHEEPNDLFGVPLTAQTWELTL